MGDGPVPDGGHSVLGDDSDGALQTGLVGPVGRRGSQLLGQLALSNGSNGAPDAEGPIQLLAEFKHHHGTEEPILSGLTTDLDGVRTTCEGGESWGCILRPWGSREWGQAVPGCSSSAWFCVTPCSSMKESSRTRCRGWQWCMVTASAPWFCTCTVNVFVSLRATGKRICPFPWSYSETISTPCFPRMNSALQKGGTEVSPAMVEISGAPVQDMGVLPLLGTALWHWWSGAGLLAWSGCRHLNICPGSAVLICHHNPPPLLPGAASISVGTAPQCVPGSCWELGPHRSPSLGVKELLHCPSSGPPLPS